MSFIFYTIIPFIAWWSRWSMCKPALIKSAEPRSNQGQKFLQLNWACGLLKHANPWASCSDSEAHLFSSCPPSMSMLLFPLWYIHLLSFCHIWEDSLPSHRKDKSRIKFIVILDYTMRKASDIIEGFDVIIFYYSFRKCYYVNIRHTSIIINKLFIFSFHMPRSSIF